MDKSKQISHQATDSDITPVKYWGNITLSVLIILANIALLRNILQVPKTTISYCSDGCSCFGHHCRIRRDPLDTSRSTENGRPDRVLYGNRVVCIWTIPLCWEEP